MNRLLAVDKPPTCAGEWLMPPGSSRLARFRLRWTGEGLRWRVANRVDKLPGQCWANLVSWVQRSDTDDHDGRALDRARALSPWRPQDSLCRMDFARNGVCYCGKLRTPEVEEAWTTE